MLKQWGRGARWLHKCALFVKLQVQQNRALRELLMKSLKPLVKTLNQVASRNLGRALVSLFVMALCETVCISALCTPLYVRVSAGDTGAGALLLAALVLLASFAVWALFQYGFAVLLLRMVRGDYVTLGYIFYGWRTLRRSLPVALFFAAVFTVLTFALVASLFCFTDVPARLVAANEITRTVMAANADGTASAVQVATGAAFRAMPVLLVAAVGALVVLCALVQLSFLFQATYDGERNSLFGALRANWRLLSRRRLLLVRFVAVAGGTPLVIALLALFATFFIPATHETGSGSSALDAVLFLLNLIYLMYGYTALLRMYFAVPVLYEEARKSTVQVVLDDESEREKDDAVISETIALLEHGVAPSDEPPQD